MSDDFSHHAQALIEILARTDPQDTRQMKRVFELSALLVQPDTADFWSQLENFPFEQIEPRVLLSLLSTPLDAEIVNRSPVDWTVAVNLPAPRLKRADDERAFFANHNHKLSLAPLFLVSSHLQQCVPAPEEAPERARHPQRCQDFQIQCLNNLESKGITGETLMYWEPLTEQQLPLREIALALNSPHLSRWLNTFQWKDEESLETTMLSLLSSLKCLHVEKMVSTWGKEKPSVAKWFNVFNTLLAQVENSTVAEVNLLRKVNLPYSGNTQLSVAQIMFQILMKEREYCQVERVEQAKKGPHHKVKPEDLGPEIKNSGSQVLKDIFVKSLHRLSHEQQQQVVKDVVHTITADPHAWNRHLHPHCVFLMEAAPASLRDTVKHELLHTTAPAGSKGQNETRNGFYLFNADPVFKGVFTPDECKTILEKEIKNCMGREKKIWPLVLLLHTSPPLVHEGIETIIKHIQSSNQSDKELRLELAALIARVDLPAHQAPKRKM